MEPFIVNPATYDKQVAVEQALTYTKAFLDLNGIPSVNNYLWAPDDAQKPPGKNPWHDKGWYWQSTLFVNVKRSRVPVKVPGFQWSYTGFKADLTAPGVLAHETGHHVHFELDKFNKRDDYASIHVTMERLSHLKSSEPAVSGYEPNLYELVAEAMRLFILNPTLLAEGRPARYRFLTEEWGLKPLHDAPWQDVLLHAHPKIIAATDKWIARGQ